MRHRHGVGPIIARSSAAPGYNCRARGRGRERHMAPRLPRALLATGGLVLALTGLATAAAPGVSCRTARPRSIEALVCGSPLLASLDAEMARLYRLAAGSEEPLVAIVAKQAQRDWLTERNRCLRSAARETCVRDRYLARIAGLRVVSRAARGDDDHGISVGPFTFRCERTDGLLTVVFVNSDPALLSISLGGRRLTMQRAPSGSGARYEGSDHGMFWEHQGEATYRESAKAPEVRCVREPVG
jgi:uncharacterized protein